MRCIFAKSAIACLMVCMAIAAIPAAHAAIEEPALRFLPPETEGLAVIDIAALRSSPFFQDALKANSALPQSIQQFVDETGIDLRTDIDKLTIAKIGQQAGVVVLQGRIDKLKVVQTLAGKGAQPDSYLGQALYRDRDGAVVILDNILLV